MWSLRAVPFLQTFFYISISLSIYIYLGSHFPRSGRGVAGEKKIFEVSQFQRSFLVVAKTPSRRFWGHFRQLLSGCRVPVALQKHGFRLVHLLKIKFSTSSLPRHLLEGPSKRSERLEASSEPFWEPFGSPFPQFDGGTCQTNSIFGRIGRCWSVSLLPDSLQSGLWAGILKPLLVVRT